MERKKGKQGQLETILKPKSVGVTVFETKNILTHLKSKNIAEHSLDENCDDCDCNTSQCIVCIVFSFIKVKQVLVSTNGDLIDTSQAE